MKTRAFFPAAAILAALAQPGQAHAALAPAGKLYKLTISTSFEPAFTDCWTFSTNGSFIHSPRLKNFPYQLTGLNTVANHFQAIWVGKISIAFAGITTGTTISGDAVDANNRTYSYTGKAVSSCPAAAATGGFKTR